MRPMWAVLLDTPLATSAAWYRKSWHRFNRAEQPNKLHPFIWRCTKGVRRPTPFGHGVRQRTHDQSALAFIDHDLVFVVNRHAPAIAGGYVWEGQAIFCRRLANIRRTPPARIRPGRPAPTMGPGTPTGADQIPGLLLAKPKLDTP
jgi:hypothetical protein